jgi:predicted DNA binding CopG/RHH family protein
LALVIGAKGKKSMSSKINYSDGPIEEVEVVADFLPSPEELVFRDDTVKVTIALSRASVEFFKEKGQQYNVPYQRMIRRLLDEYARTYTEPERSFE